MTTTPRSEYPRPDLARADWLCLNGRWDFFMDRDNTLDNVQSAMEKPFPQEIVVPFCYQSEMSGIGLDVPCDSVWYRRGFDLDARQAASGVQLHFGAVDYEARVWVNGHLAGSHRGGHTAFWFDITALVRQGGNTLLVQAVDTTSTTQPRGKQSWRGQNFACWYTPTTGIWQNVWLTFTKTGRYVTAARVTPDLDALTAVLEVETHSAAGCEARIAACYELDGQRETVRGAARCGADGAARAVLAFPDYDHVAFDNFYWTPEHPNLIDVAVELWDGDVCVDRVDTYFGFRKISAQNGALLLNNRPYFQRLVLDQGYWPASLLTPPSDEALIRDIELAKAMGFNGARKHQKVEDPRYYYWADKLGFLVWGELPSTYAFSAATAEKSAAELAEFVMRDYNHPSIVLWVPLNESWGVRDILSDARQQDYARWLYYMLKTLDPTRLVSTNDGWEQVEPSDICALHDYAIFEDNLDKYDDPVSYTAKPVEWRLPYAQDNRYRGQPVLLTEYGGVAFAEKDDESWGYYGAVRDEAEFLARVEAATGLLVQSRNRFAGFCYTQLTDVMQEVNGLLNAERQPKVPVEKLRAVFGQVRY